jgi:uncharacterized protein (DUF4415 family)
MRKNASRPDVDNPEWTAEEVRRARPVRDVLPNETARPFADIEVSAVRKRAVAAYRATGSGWQKRANEALRADATKRGLVAQVRGPRQSGRKKAVEAMVARESAKRLASLGGSDTTAQARRRPSIRRKPA